VHGAGSWHFSGYVPLLGCRTTGLVDISDAESTALSCARWCVTSMFSLETVSDISDRGRPKDLLPAGTGLKASSISGKVDSAGGSEVDSSCRPTSPLR
jgi:hypothetical protein